jgi:2'-5' RNA ligase
MGELIRTFIAIEIPDSIKAAMADVQGALRKTGADVGWTRPEGVHLTLKFLGPVEAQLISKLSAALEAAIKDEATLTVDVKGTGVFPNARAPRVVWLGLGGDIDAMASLAKKVDAACEGLGFKPEGRPFKPHLTLGRVKSSKGSKALMDALKSFENVELGGFRAESVSIMKSELKPSGAVYTEMYRISLQGLGDF